MQPVQVKAASFISKIEIFTLLVFTNFYRLKIKCNIFYPAIALFWQKRYNIYHYGRIIRNRKILSE